VRVLIDDDTRRMMKYSQRDERPARRGCYSNASFRPFLRIRAIQKGISDNLFRRYGVKRYSLASETLINGSYISETPVGGGYTRARARARVCVCGAEVI